MINFDGIYQGLSKAEVDAAPPTELAKLFITSLVDSLPLEAYLYCDLPTNPLRIDA